MKDWKFSGFSGEFCSLCGKEITNAMLSYSMRFFKKPLCRFCQRLQDVVEEDEEKIWKEKDRT